MPLDVSGHQRIEEGVFLRGQGAGFNENVAQRALLVEHPDVHGRQERIAADEVHLQGKDAEEQVAVSVQRRHGGGR